MKAFSVSILLAAFAAAGVAQSWEIGGVAGGSLNSSVTSKAASGSTPAGEATAGFTKGMIFGGYLGQNMYKHVSGEIHYAYVKNNLRLQGPGQEVTFGAESHAVYYDVLLHSAAKKTQWFAAIGAGMKIFRGTGQENAYQPLNQFAYLTKTQELKPLLSVGAGVRHFVGKRTVLRVEVRDYITPFPTKVLAPAGNAKFSGSVLHNIVPSVGIGYLF